MLGEQISELKGKIMGQRVLDVEGPSIETTTSLTGSFNGTQMSENLSFTSRPISSGVLHVKGFGVIMAGESDMATYTGEGVGRISS